MISQKRYINQNSRRFALSWHSQCVVYTSSFLVRQHSVRIVTSISIYARAYSAKIWGSHYFLFPGSISYFKLEKIEKLEKSQNLLKLLNSCRVRGGRRVPSKNYDFCDFSKNCEKLEQSQNLLKLLKSSLGPNDYNSWLTSENNCYIEVNDAVLRCSMKIYDVAFRWVFLSM